MILNNKIVLVVDDDPDFSKIISKILERLGMIVHIADCLDEAISKAEEMVPHLVILDVKLGKENGLHFLKYRQDSLIFQEMVVLTCSSKDKEEILEKSKLIGASDYVVKPIKQTSLIHKIKRAFSTIDPLEYSYEKDLGPVVEGIIEGKLIKISETSCVIRSNLKLPKGERLKIDIDFFDSEEIGPGYYEVEDESLAAVDSASEYHTNLTMLGLSHDDTKKIRKLKLRWNKEK